MHAFMQWSFLSQGHAEDVLMWYAYHYYVLGKSLISDADFDSLMEQVRARWSVSYATHCVGSSNGADYPVYIRENRRPGERERTLRDQAIVARWLKHL